MRIPSEAVLLSLLLLLLHASPELARSQQQPIDFFASAGEELVQVMPHILSFVAPSHEERLELALLSKTLKVVVEKYSEIVYKNILRKADTTFPDRIHQYLGNRYVENQPVVTPFRCRLGAAVRIPLYRILRQVSGARDRRSDMS